MRSLNGAYIDLCWITTWEYQTVLNLADDGFLQLFKHILFTSCFVIETYETGLLCAAHAALVRVLRTAFTRIVQNVLAEPYQNEYC